MTSNLVFLCVQVLETYNYEDIGEVSAIKNNGLQLVMHTGGRVVVTTDKAGKEKKFGIWFNHFRYNYI